MRENSNVTLYDLVGRKLELEEHIQKALAEFTEDTGLRVQDIRFQRMDIRGDDRILSSSYNIKLEVLL